MFQKIKNRIKIAKISGIIITILFILMLLSNVLLYYKMIKMENNIEKLNQSRIDIAVN